MADVGALVLVAEPGAGKTTRVPAALLPLLPEGQELWVLQPRRIAARTAAVRVAEEMGEPVGQTIGYQVRFEEKVSKKTRVRFVTEGILTRRLMRDPSLTGIWGVVLDEFHERHIHTDLALAFGQRLRGERADFRLVVMSATLVADPVARFLNAPTMHVEGRCFPVEIEYQAPRERSRLEDEVARGVRRLLVRGVDGDVLVFLPGVGEIQRASEACERVLRELGRDIEVLPLHGALPARDQDRAVRASKKARIILATNVAETSVTLPNVAAVVDSGLARIARHSPWSGLSSLEVSKVCKASLTQRAGRAGRTRAGLCLRLFEEADLQNRAAEDDPEIRRADLSELSLMLRAQGHDPLHFPFFEAPKEAAWRSSIELLTLLGAIDADGRITDVGRALLRVPAHPRLGRLLVAAKEADVGPRGALLAALIEHRSPRLVSRGGAKDLASGPSDLLEDLERVEAARADGGSPSACRRHELDAGTVRLVLRSRDQLARAIGVRTEPDNALRDESDALLRALLLSFPDRVGRRRANKPSEFVFAAGGAARLDEMSVVRDAEFIVAVDAARVGRGQTSIRRASQIEDDWLLEYFEGRIKAHVEVRFDESVHRVRVLSQLRFDDLVLDETRNEDTSAPEVAECLVGEAMRRGLASFCDEERIDRLRRRMAFARTYDETIPEWTDETLHAWLLEFAAGMASFAELRDGRFDAFVPLQLSAESRASLQRIAPESVPIAGRPNGVTISYESGRDPYIESRMQDFFGTAVTPTVAGGQKPLVLHLLAPNQRAVQVTTDLEGFWSKHYPGLRKQLMRRYPKHFWPEDPLEAEARRMNRPRR